MARVEQTITRHQRGGVEVVVAYDDSTGGWDEDGNPIDGGPDLLDVRLRAGPGVSARVLIYRSNGRLWQDRTVVGPLDVVLPALGPVRKWADIPGFVVVGG